MTDIIIKKEHEPFSLTLSFNKFVPLSSLFIIRTQKILGPVKLFQPEVRAPSGGLKLAQVEFVAKGLSDALVLQKTTVLK